MVWRIVFGIVLTLSDGLALGLDQAEPTEESMMLVQRRARITEDLSRLAKEEAEEYLEGGSEEDEWEELDAEQALAETDQWAGGYKRCWGSPQGAHSACKVVGGGVGFAESPQLCAFKAREIGADTFQFLQHNHRCWLKVCNSVNMKYSTKNRRRPWKIYSTYCGLERIHTEVPANDCGGTEFTNYLIFPRPPAEVCDKALSFTSVTSNNLNGKGPSGGSKTLRFKNVLPGIDLVAKSDDQYEPKDSSKNGVTADGYGRLNMLPNTETFVTFRFLQNTSQTPVKVSKFMFSIFDVDQGRRCETRMTITASKYAAYYVDPDSELVVKTDIGDVDHPASCTFKSSQMGTGADNPEVPTNLNAAQSARTVTLEYQNIKFFTLGFKMGEGRGGRNVLFGGLSSLTTDVCSEDSDAAPEDSDAAA